MKIENLNFYNYCLPSLIYLIYSIISIILDFFKHYKLILSIFNIIFVVIWTWILNFFCSEGYEFVSWILLFIPFLLFLFFILYLYILKIKGMDFKIMDINFTTSFL